MLALRAIITSHSKANVHIALYFVKFKHSFKNPSFETISIKLDKSTGTQLCMHLHNKNHVDHLKSLIHIIDENSIGLHKFINLLNVLKM